MNTIICCYSGHHHGLLTVKDRIQSLLYQHIVNTSKYIISWIDKKMRKLPWLPHGLSYISHRLAMDQEDP